MSESPPLLQIEDLGVRFSTPSGDAHVVNGLNLQLSPGQIHGLVGESGSGKSVTARSVLGLLPFHSISALEGVVRFDGQNLLEMSDVEMRDLIRGRRISMIFQDPMTALNPVMRVGKQMMIPICRHLGLSRADAKRRAIELLDSVGVPNAVERMRSFPHELSGGQRQRVMIAIALSCDPDVLIADEPTTALDVTIQAQVMDLFEDLRQSRDLAILLVSHDLTLIAERCDDVSVMYAGRIVETGGARDIFATPAHPYTRLLESARPKLDERSAGPLLTIRGTSPDLRRLPAGCSFAPRCPDATDRCLSQPEVEPWGLGRTVRCFHPAPISRSAPDSQSDESILKVVEA